jgi:Flp pilus assembly protein TadG
MPPTLRRPDRAHLRTRREHSERGAILIQLGILLLVLIAFIGFVADQGLLFFGRRQAQNAADAGAHAGATALAFDDDDRSATGPAKTSAYRFATLNAVAGEAPSVIDPATGDSTDVKFYSDDPTAFPEECDDDWCIRVDVYRNQARGNPLLAWFMRAVGVNEYGVKATAIARASPASFADCLKPWLIPDKWIEHLAPATQFNYSDNPSVQGDEYVKPGWSTLDIGTELVLKEGNPSTSDPIAPGDFYRIEPADTYEEAIVGCEIQKGIGDIVTIRPGNGVGPTKHGVEDLLAAHDGGPVTVQVGMFDPAAFEALDRQSGTFDIEIVNIMGFRIEAYGPGNQVRGTIVAASGLTTGEEDEDVSGELLKAVQLIR